VARFEQVKRSHPTQPTIRRAKQAALERVAHYFLRSDA
jgi:hypothetical protein